MAGTTRNCRICMSPVGEADPICPLCGGEAGYWCQDHESWGERDGCFLCAWSTGGNTSSSLGEPGRAARNQEVQDLCDAGDVERALATAKRIEEETGRPPQETPLLTAAAAAWRALYDFVHKHDARVEIHFTQHLLDEAREAFGKADVRTLAIDRLALAMHLEPAVALEPGSPGRIGLLPLQPPPRRTPEYRRPDKVQVMLEGREAGTTSCESQPKRLTAAGSSHGGPQGSESGENTMFCPYCGKNVLSSAVVCVGCGSPLKQSSTAGGGIVAWAYILAFLMPIIGFILGIVLLVRGRVGHGIGALVLSFFSCYFWVGFMAGLAGSLE